MRPGEEGRLDQVAVVGGVRLRRVEELVEVVVGPKFYNCHGATCFAAFNHANKAYEILRLLWMISRRSH